MKLVSGKTTLTEIKRMAVQRFGNLVKAVVDVKQEIMVVDGELHADEEAVLLEKGSQQEDLWGINIYPEFSDDNFIGFDSMINLRPSSGNKSRNVEDLKTRKKIIRIVNKLINK